MAFANLFTRLSAISEDVKSPGDPAFTLRKQSGNDGHSNARKRKPKSEWSGPHRKKRRYQDYKVDTYNATSFEYTDLRAMPSSWQGTGNEDASIGFSTKNNYRNKADHTDRFQKGRSHTTTNKFNGTGQQHKTVKMKKGQKKQHDVKDKRKNTNRDGRHQTRENLKSGGKFWKCKDGTQDVQVKFTRHMTQDFKDQNALSVDGRLLCRHYLWGRCIKGDDCQLEHIQGHNNLIKEVCKFYVQGFCTKGESCPYMHKSFPCKFFHRKGKCSQGADCRFSHEPLNEVTKQLVEEALKRETDYQLASKAEQDTSEQPATTGEPEITDTNTASDVQMQLLRPNFYNSEQNSTEKEALLSQDDEPSNNVEQTCPSQPHSPPSSECIQEEPVCYSVEAVLGRQHFKPFPSFISTGLDQESSSFPSSEFTSSSVHESEVPYSVDAFLRSYKSAENSTLGYTLSSLPAQTESEDVKKVSPYQAAGGLLPQTCSHPTPVSRNRTKQAGEIPKSPKPSQSDLPVTVVEKSSKSKGDVKERTCLPNVTCSLNTEGKSNRPFTCDAGKSLTCTSKHLTLKPHVTGQTLINQASVRFTGSSTGLSQSKVAVSAKPAINPDKSADSRNYASRFAPCTHKDTHVKTAATPDKPCTNSFFSLFASPLLPAPVPPQPQACELGAASSKQSVEVPHLADSRQRASNSETPHQCPAKIDETSHMQSSPKLTTCPKNKNEKTLNRCEAPERDPTCALRDSLGDMSGSASCGKCPDSKGPAAAATANSVLKTLFLCLSPYQQDEGQDSPLLNVPSENEKNNSSTQPKNRRKKQKTRQSCSETVVAESIKPQAFFQSPQMPLDATGDLSVCSRVCKPLVRSSGKHKPPTRAETPKLRPATEEGKCVHGDEVLTPLSDLFRILDTTVFHLGH